VEKGVKICADNYVSEILVPIAKGVPLCNFRDKDWWFQNDNAPAPAARTSKAENYPDFTILSAGRNGLPAHPI